MRGKLVKGKNEALDAEDKYKTDVERTAEYVERFDILETITNTGNDEVFTPRKIVDQMLDLLPEKVWHDPNLKWLNPATKTGIFEREIAIRLDEGLKEVMPDLETRRKHILQKMIFSIGQTKFTSHVARRTLYYCSTANRACDGIKENGHYVNGYAIGNGSWFDDAEGNIKTPSIDHDFDPKTGKCRFCGVGKTSKYNDDSQREKYSYEFLHCNLGSDLQKHLSKRFFKGDEGVKFDVIVGNPPYQLDDEGNNASSRPIYQKFVQQAKSLDPKYLCMIMPTRWYAGGKGLDQFRAEMLNDDSIYSLVDFVNAKDCFPSQDISGGICYFMRDRDYHGSTNYTTCNGNKVSDTVRSLNEFDVFVRYNEALAIIRKIRAFKEKTENLSVYPRNPFKLSSSYRGHLSKEKDTDLTVLTSGGTVYCDISEIKSNQSIIPKYKVILSYAIAEHAGVPNKDGKFTVISTNKVLNPNEICTESYLVLYTTDTRSEAENYLTYLKCKFYRFLLQMAITSIHITMDTFQFVPSQNYSKPLSDEMLYKKYGLTQEEIDFIEGLIREKE